MASAFVLCLMLGLFVVVNAAIDDSAFQNRCHKLDGYVDARAGLCLKPSGAVLGDRETLS